MTESSTLSEYGKVYTDLPEVVPNCQVSLRGCGLPHQCAHWFAMTCRRQRRVSECKDVGCSDMLKAVACQRVQGRVWRVRCAEPCHASVVAEVFGAMTPLPPVIARSEATWQSVTPAVRQQSAPVTAARSPPTPSGYCTPRRYGCAHSHGRHTPQGR